MDKTIVVLDGISEGKTKFIEIAKQEGFWTWNINHRNVLSMLCWKLGWGGDRNKNFYVFLDEFNNISNEYFDFENWYIGGMIDKFNNNAKANLLIIHSCNKNTSKQLQESQDNCYNIIITNTESEINDEYCKTLNYKADNYRDTVITTLNIMTDKKEQ